MIALGTKFKTYNKLIGADNIQDGFQTGLPHRFAHLQLIFPFFCSQRAKTSKTTPPFAVKVQGIQLPALAHSYDRDDSSVSSQNFGITRPELVEGRWFRQAQPTTTLHY